MKRCGVTVLGPVMALTFALALRAGATVIDFETQAADRGGSLTGIPDSPLTIGIATFTGGELLRGEVGLNADPTGVYASEGLFGSGETNPLVISFAVPVQDVSVFVLNGDDVRSYTVSDNIGDSATNSLASSGGLGAATFSLPGNRLSTLKVTSANSNAWDFAIDNVTFTEAATSTPEPESIFLLGAGFVLLGAICRRRLHN